MDANALEAEIVDITPAHVTGDRTAGAASTAAGPNPPDLSIVPVSGSNLFDTKT